MSVVIVRERAERYKRNREQKVTHKQIQSNVFPNCASATIIIIIIRFFFIRIWYTRTKIAEEKSALTIENYGFN